MQDIQVFIGFANFYWHFIQSFNRIAAPLTSMLKTIRLLDLAPRLAANDNEVVGDGGKANNRNSFKKLKNIKSGIQTRIGATKKLTFLTSIAKKAFNQLR